MRFPIVPAPASAGSYRLAPDEVLDLLAAVETQRIDATALGRGFAVALAAIGNTDDPQTDAIIHALGGIDGDVRDAPARIDARIERVVQAATAVGAAVTAGDEEMAGRIASATP